MATRACSKCRAEDVVFYPSGGSWCKQCVAADHARRHREKYGPALRAGRRQRHWHKKAPRASLRSDIERAYAAGLVDGEGCLRITYKAKHQRYVAMIELANTSKAMIDWLLERWGGRAAWTPDNYEKNRKANTRWTLVADQALPFLDDIFPYLVVKRKQTALVRRYQRYVQYGGRHGDPRVEPLQRRFYDMLRVLNRRGVRHSE